MTEHGPAQERAERASVYVFFHHVGQGIVAFMHRHRVLMMILGTLGLLGLFIARSLLHPAALFLRVHSAEVIGLVVLFIVLMLLKRRGRFKTMCVALVVATGLIFLVYGLGLSPQEYISLDIQHNELKWVELKELPETDYERIQPLGAVKTVANEAMSIVEQASAPHVVRVGQDYRFTFAIEPTYIMPQIFGNITEIVNVSATSPSLNFSAVNRIKVDFPVAEGLLLGKNTKVSVIRALSPLRFFSYDPVDVRYVPDDSGEIVQLVSMLRYRGIFFPRPEFGGVYVIRQSKGGFLHFLKTVFVGEGEWIRPEDVSKYEYLRKQNIVPYEVSRYIANSFRFEEGFFAPFPGYHRGDIRIPDLPGDSNDQPFCLFFRLEGKGGEDKLYHYFALEPFQEDKQGLNTSLFVPADGIGKVLVYQHFKRGDALVGVSAIGAKVRSSQKMIDWAHNSIAEQRPYIRNIDGATRFLWLSTVVTFKDHEGKGDYIAGSTPQITLTDALYQQVVWVDSLRPETWVESVRNQLSPSWQH